jgi:hypothetical protein
MAGDMMPASSFSWNTKEWDKLLSRCVAMKRLAAKIGIQGEKASEPHAEGQPLTNAEIAAVHELSGPQDSPPGRPWIRPPYDNDPGKWKGQIAEACKNVIKGANPTAELRRVGERYRTAIVDRVKAGIDPPLSEKTINQRAGQNTQGKHDKLETKGKALDTTPLWDTGTMIGALSVVVDKA